MFVSLFNLQGAHRSSAAGFHLTTASRLCQELFSSFSTFFVLSSAALPGKPLSSRTARLDYHISRRLSSTFFCLFETFFVSLGRPSPGAFVALPRSFASSPAAPPEALDYTSRLLSSCQPIFSDFSYFFHALRNPPRNSASGGHLAA